LNREKAIRAIGRLTNYLRKRGIHHNEDYKDWVEDDDDDILADALGYRRLTGMPAIGALVRPYFHPTRPLVLWNYTDTAHRTLHLYADGWTRPIRQCRGIVFTTDGQLVALPFEKFFNYGQHPETKNLPNEPFEITEKHDGHLGIIFRTNGELQLTTRGTFESHTAVIGRKMLKEMNRKAWSKYLPEGLTLLVEIIHPDTEIYRKYRGQRFIAIGSYENATLRPLPHAALKDLAKKLEISCTELARFGSISELGHHMTEPVENREGFVLHFPKSDIRAKFKFQAYLGLINRLIVGDWDEKKRMLDEDALGDANRIETAIRGAKTAEELYALVPSESRSSAYKDACRRYLRQNPDQPLDAT
jgi:hypothetical protein